MKGVALIFVLLIPLILRAQEGMPEPEYPDLGTPLREHIAQMAESSQPSGADYLSMAEQTLQFAMSEMQQGRKMPEPPLRDALDAIETGREIDPDAGDWDQIEQRLLDLLNPPVDPENQQQQQQQDSGDNSEQQDGEQGESGEQQQSEDGQSQDSESQDGEQSEGEQGEQSQDQQGEQQEGDSESQPDEQQEPGDSNSAGEQDPEGEQGQQLPQAQDGAQMGDLEEPQEVELDGQEEQAPPPPQPSATPEEMQTLGGQQGTGEPIDAENAALMQMLEQLKQQDEPGKLYKILQEAQNGGRQKSQPNTKDW
ncbi:hypothetical protein [Pelagicoccus albus]|uniref:Uncharacterized protein n=1 Tax=Pelagicoccus albus TaxID=415222 RepID=A0A7X1E9I5_9BACT|nr:hypothetical protein [Pelagicoccus albus]MBC2607459.1 hypothetical protein [Pelagicoccus albus]